LKEEPWGCGGLPFFQCPQHVRIINIRQGGTAGAGKSRFHDFHFNEGFGVAAYHVPPPLPFVQGKQFIPEGGGKQDRASRLSPAAGLDYTAGPAGLHNPAYRGGVKEGLIAGKKHTILRRPGGLKPQPYAFPLAPAGVFVADRRNRQSPGQGKDRFFGGDKNNPGKAVKAADQIQGMPGQGFSPEGGQEFVGFPKAF
jgi:hypothetical protein